MKEEEIRFTYAGSEKMKKKKVSKEVDLIKSILHFATGWYIGVITHFTINKLIEDYIKLEKEHREKGEIAIANAYKEEIEWLKKEYLKVRK